jgi:hypothetical protein
VAPKKAKNPLTGSRESLLTGKNKGVGPGVIAEKFLASPSVLAIGGYNKSGGVFIMNNRTTAERVRPKKPYTPQFSTPASYSRSPLNAAKAATLLGNGP